MANHLKNQKSPYLLQHVNNPVDWYPWADEAFEKAKTENKPIFLSVGYSTCHWCHVMAHESFEDNDVAKVLNEKFVCIKVDREERPDVDAAYMMVCQMLIGHGGWPLSIFMSPDKKPFFAGTYFPKDSDYGRVGFLDLLGKVDHVWTSQKNEVHATIAGIEQALSTLQNPKNQAAHSVSVQDLLEQTEVEMNEMFDKELGGFGSRPKFPSPQKLLFLLDDYRYNKNQKSLEMAEKTLFEMHRGGIYDHLGGGFHRYATDEKWEVPHFEKMLYDQAWISYAFVTAYELTNNIFYKDIAEQIFLNVQSDFLLSGGGFASSHDADSEGEEGKFYIWSKSELKKTLSGPEFDFLEKNFVITDDGNYLDEATHKKTGHNILFLKESMQKKSTLETQTFFSEWQTLRLKLVPERNKRVKPLRDEKVLADWNCFMVASLFKGFKIFKDERWKNLAEQVLGFIDSEMKLKNYIFHRYCEGELLKSEFFDDQAAYIWANMNAYEATADKKYLKSIEPHLARVEAVYKSDLGGYFMTANDQEFVLTRLREFYDGAYPSANSVYMACLMKLSMYMKQESLASIYKENLKNLFETYRHGPSAHAMAMVACQFFLHPFCEEGLC